MIKYRSGKVSLLSIGIILIHGGATMARKIKSKIVNVADLKEIGEKIAQEYSEIAEGRWPDFVAKETARENYKQAVVSYADGGNLFEAVNSAKKTGLWCIQGQQRAFVRNILYPGVLLSISDLEEVLDDSDLEAVREKEDVLRTIIRSDDYFDLREASMAYWEYRKILEQTQELRKQRTLEKLNVKSKKQEKIERRRKTAEELLKLVG